MILAPLTMIVALLLAHFLADYALQGDFMAKAKNHKAPFPGVPWQTVLLSHSAIHAAAVYLITGSLIMGATELIGHALTDWAKCDGRIGYNTDQAIHIGMKAAYVLAVAA